MQIVVNPPNDFPVVRQINVHDVDIDKFVIQYLPPFLRTRKTFFFLHSLLAPLQRFRNWLVNTYHPLIERKARYNSQVIVFEKLLNDTFTTSGIFINHSARLDRVYCFNELENQPLYMYNDSESLPVYLSNLVEYEPLFDFTVNVPQSVYNTSLPKIRAVVERYKLIGVNYNIIAYSPGNIHVVTEDI